MDGTRFEHGARAGQVVSTLLVVLLASIAVVLAVGGAWTAALLTAALAVPFAALLWRGRRTGIWVHADSVTVVQLTSSRTIPAVDIERVERVDLSGQGIVGSHVGLVTRDGTTITVNSVVWPTEGGPGHARFLETLAGLESAIERARGVGRRGAS